MKILDCGPLFVCVDCLMLIANDESTDEHRAAFKAWQDEYGDGDDAMLVPGDDEDSFSTHRCDGCGTTLAGYRHEVFALVNDDA